MLINDPIDDVEALNEFKDQLEDSFDLRNYLFDNANTDQFYIGEYRGVPDYKKYKINSIYKNSSNKTAFINTTNGWVPLIRDGEKGQTGLQGPPGKDGYYGYGGGGLGERDTLALIARELAQWAIDHPGGGSSALPTSGVFIDPLTGSITPMYFNLPGGFPTPTSGVFIDPIVGSTSPIYFATLPNLLTSRGIQSLDGSVSASTPFSINITHQVIDTSFKAPFVNLLIPSSSASNLNFAILNRSSTSFDVQFNDAPLTSGYSFSWAV